MLVAVGDSEEPIVQGYLPVSNLKELVGGIPIPGGDAPAPNAKGVYEIPSGGKTLYAKQKGQWAVLSDSEDSLNAAADDPTPQISDLAKKYLVAVRGNVQNVPLARRQQIPSPRCGPW